MNLDDLKVIRNDERRSRKLTPLKDTFYSDLKDYLSSLTGSEDPQKRDEYKNALQVAEAIYDKRVAKIMKLAALAAKGHSEGAPLTEEEKKLFEMIFNVFTLYKADMLAHGVSRTVQGILPPAEKHGIPSDIETPLKDSHRAKDEGAGTREEESGIVGSTIFEESDDLSKDIQRLDNTRALIQENKNMKYVQVRVLADIPAFVGLDGENYKLSKGETALLPEGNVRALIKRQVAIIIGDKVEDA